MSIHRIAISIDYQRLILRFATGTDLITPMTRYIVGDSVPAVEQKPYLGHWAEVILHAEKDGRFEGIEAAAGFKGEVVEEDMRVEKGEEVHSFMGANDAIGTLVLKFDTKNEMTDTIENIHSWVGIKVK